MITRRGPLVAMAALCVVSVAGCSSSSAPVNTTTTSIPTPEIHPGTVSINGKSVQVPVLQPGTPIGSAYDTAVSQNIAQGQVIISSKGMLPYSLLTRLHEPVVFTNLTTKPVKLTFKYVPVFSSEWIPAGGTWTYPNTGGSYSLWYTTNTGYRGNLNIGALGF